jgi:hypothetical protein
MALFYLLQKGPMLEEEFGQVRPRQSRGEVIYLRRQKRRKCIRHRQIAN